MFLHPESPRVDDLFDQY